MQLIVPKITTSSQTDIRHFRDLGGRNREGTTIPRITFKLFTNTRTRWSHNERNYNIARG